MTAPGAFTPPELAARLNVCLSTLAVWRASGTGPPFRQIGRVIRYDLVAVQAWLRGDVARGLACQAELITEDPEQPPGTATHHPRSESDTRPATNGRAGRRPLSGRLQDLLASLRSPGAYGR
jgi:hypothetical protein